MSETTTSRPALLVDTHELAELLKMSESQIRRLCRTGVLPTPIRFGRRCVRHSVQAVSEALDAMAAGGDQED